MGNVRVRAGGLPGGTVAILLLDEHGTPLAEEHGLTLIVAVDTGRGVVAGGTPGATARPG